MEKTVIYLDFNATTPIDSSVLDCMMPWLTDRFWNASSSHWGGRAAASAVETARAQVASLVGSTRGELIWTSGATEANNLAIKGAAEMTNPARRRIVTFATEHKSVLDSVEWMRSQGYPVSIVPVGTDGSVRLDELEVVLSKGDVALVSVMAANNETGVISDLRAIADLAHANGAIVHTDATQVVGRIPFDVFDSGVDMASMSAHKLYGPKGVGALYVSRATELSAQLHGGGHERGLRSGTLNVPAIVGFGAAAKLAGDLIESEPRRQRELTDLFVTILKSHIPLVEQTTKYSTRLPNTANLRIIGADAEAVMANAPEVAISSGSACTALVPSASHVLVAMGLTEEACMECLRISIGRSTTREDVLTAARLIAESAARVRAFRDDFSKDLSSRDGA